MPADWVLSCLTKHKTLTPASCSSQAECEENYSILSTACPGSFRDRATLLGPQGLAQRPASAACCALHFLRGKPALIFTRTRATARLCRRRPATLGAQGLGGGPRAASGGRPAPPASAATPRGREARARAVSDSARGQLGGAGRSRGSETCSRAGGTEQTG